uniref:Uncharacterized protein n=1 Tax=Zea mays TaxID=4577 RepID=C0P9A0_MAIZE|nr:unknown [Zea mays]
MAGGDRERDADEETRNQMMQNLFGDQSEDEDDADDDDVAEMVDEDDGHQPQSPPQSPPQRHQELDDDAPQRRLRYLRRRRCLCGRAGCRLRSSQDLGDEQPREKVRRHTSFGAEASRRMIYFGRHLAPV